MQGNINGKIYAFDPVTDRNAPVTLRISHSKVNGGEFIEEIIFPNFQACLDYHQSVIDASNG